MQHNQPVETLVETMLESCMGSRVGRLHRLVDRQFDQHLRPLGLSVPQMEVLSALTLIGRPVKPSFLADVLSMERSTMSRNLSIMQERGWVEPGDVSATGRSMSVVISREGVLKLESAETAWREAQEAVVAALGTDAPSTLDDWLNKLVADR